MSPVSSHCRALMASPHRPLRRFSRFAAAALFVCASAGFAHAAEPAAVRLFGSSEKAHHDLSQFPKWTGMLERYARERALEDAPCRGPCPLQRWRGFLLGIQGKSAAEQLAAVNDYVNRTPYATDQQRYGVVDHWATPAEFLGRSGDCEDYAIAKYLSLRHLGWDERNLRILVLNDQNRRELHAVLIAYHGGTAYVLDNQVSEVLEHGAVRQYRPIFSINAAAWFFHEGWSPAAPATVSSDLAAPPASWPAVAPAPASAALALGSLR